MIRKTMPLQLLMPLAFILFGCAAQARIPGPPEVRYDMPERLVRHSCVLKLRYSFTDFLGRTGQAVLWNEFTSQGDSNQEVLKQLNKNADAAVAAAVDDGREEDGFSRAVFCSAQAFSKLN